MVRSLIIGTTLLWAAVAILPPLGYWLVALFVLIALLVVHAALGTTRAGALDLPLLGPVVVPWAVLWAVAFALAEYFASASAGERPSFVLGGLHPSYGVMVVFYWVGATVAITWAFHVYRDRWLSEERWEAFKASVEGDEESSP